MQDVYKRQALHQAILQCVQTVAGDKDDIMQNLRDVQENIILFSGSQVTPQSLEKQINKLEQEMSALVMICLLYTSRCV